MPSPTLYEVATVTFVCGCDASVRSACEGLPFYKKHEDKRYCVLHYPGKDKSAAFNEALHKKLEAEDFDFRGVWFPDEVDFSYRTFAGPAHFDSAKFSADAHFASATFDAEASFVFTTFDETAYFSSAKFGAHTSFNSAKFGATADFNDATFNAEATFVLAAFGAMVYFNSAAFGAETDFNFAKFGAKVDFVSAKFSAPVSFSSIGFGAETYFASVYFGASASFVSTKFGAYTSFESAEFAYSNFNSARFGAEVSFVSARFRAEALFRYATFDARAAFDHATFRAQADFGLATFKDYVRFAGTEEVQAFRGEASLSLQLARIEKPDRFSFHTLTLRPGWFVNVDSRKFEFINVNWGRLSTALRINTRLEVKTLENRVSSAHSLLAIACRNLAVNAEENHRYEEASRFRYMAMDARRLERWHGFAFWTLDWWYGLASGYGERVWHAFVMLISVWLLAAALYTRVGFVRWEPRVSNAQEATEAKRDDVGAPLRWQRALTYSLGVMTLQKPEPRPATNAAQGLVMLETILGPVQAALLALAIRRKFMR